MATIPLSATEVIPVPDAALVRRMARRDSTALVELQRRYSASLYALVYGILMDAERADRLVTEVFEQAWHAAELMSERHRGAHSWLRQAARERALKDRATPESR
jgi:DNA-directed RNA polymerase specialized sigma24 family protein